MRKKSLLALILITIGAALISLTYRGFSPHPAQDTNSVADPRRHRASSDRQGLPPSRSSHPRRHGAGRTAAPRQDQNDVDIALGLPLIREIDRGAAAPNQDQKDVDIILGRSPRYRSHGHTAVQGPDRNDSDIPLKHPLNHHYDRHSGRKHPDQTDAGISLERPAYHPSAAGGNVSSSFSSSSSSSSSFLPTSKQEARHLFFLKVHKAASSTVLNVVYRFALSRRLVVLLPTPAMNNILSETSFAWAHNADRLPPGASHFDVLCNHLIFEEASVRRAMPGDTAFVGIVRHPFRQFVSAFRYYSTVYPKQYLTDIPGQDPISTYLRQPDWWEPLDAQLSYTNNRMSVDFGMDPFRLTDPTYVRDYVEVYLDRIFDLVMVSDRFDESILLMRRLLGWKIEDVVYISNNVGSGGGSGDGGGGGGGGRQFLRKTFTAREKRIHEAFNLADYTLYRHFAKVLDDKVREAGEDFAREVRAFKTIIKAVSRYCLGDNDSSKSNHNRSNHDNSSQRGSNSSTDGSVSLMVPATLWNEAFWVTRDDCRFLLIEENTFVPIVRLGNANRRN